MVAAWLRAVLTPCLLGAVAGHAVLTIPTARTHAGGALGLKLTPADDAESVANQGCGGAPNGDPGIQEPSSVLQAGSTAGVAWDVTIPHESSNLNAGVRIAICYSPNDCFAQNVVAGGFNGELSAGSESAAIEVPPKTCRFCILQFVWKAVDDGGYYITCSDVAITLDGGLLPEYTATELARELGQTLPSGIDVTDLAGNAISSASSGGGDGAGIALGIIFPLLFIAGVFLWYRRQQARGEGFFEPCMGGKKDSYPGSMNAETGSAAVALPPGWSAVVDPNSGRTYYSNVDGTTSWDPPTSGAKAASEPALPNGWTSATDPATGKQYYVNSVTNATTWTIPTESV